MINGIRRLTEYALKRDLQVEETYQITESSTKETRKQFDQIISIIKKSKHPKALITDTVDMLQRSFRETPILDELRKQGKLELHFLREGLVINQNSNSAQLLQWNIGVLFSSSYVRQLSDNVKRSKEQSVRDGDWIGKALFGYKNITLPTEKKIIEVDFANAPFVIKMFEMYATGDIKKKKYIYYSCNNSKRTCKKIWTREEHLLAPFLQDSSNRCSNRKCCSFLKAFLRP